jgi:hypothetical protein
MRTPNGLRIFGAGISSSDKQRPAVAARVATRLWCGAPILYAMPASRELQRQLKRRELCLPRAAKRPPIGPGWIHEIKHGGVRILAERDAAGVTLPKGYDFADRFLLCPGRGSGCLKPPSPPSPSRRAGIFCNRKRECSAVRLGQCGEQAASQRCNADIAPRSNDFVFRRISLSQA